MSAPSQSQSSLSAARRCMRLHELRYNQMLEPDADEGREAMDVGSCWHFALAARAEGRDPYEEIVSHAPSPLWMVKLARLFAARELYWREQDAELVYERAEKTFIAGWRGRRYVGQVDAVVRTMDGRSGIIESKTTSDSLDPDSVYWKRLRLDVQVGLYALAELRPDFILYDVVRKPTIRPAGITKKEVERMRREVDARGAASYFGEEFAADVLAAPLAEAHEDALLYGARLTADICGTPEKYFARREVPRTQRDYEALLVDLDAQSRLIEVAEGEGLWPRNPDACHARDRATCEFFALCSRNEYPSRGDAAPAGYRKRTLRHPELGGAVE